MIVHNSDLLNVRTTGQMFQLISRDEYFRALQIIQSLCVTLRIKRKLFWQRFDLKESSMRAQLVQDMQSGETDAIGATFALRTIRVLLPPENCGWIKSITGFFIGRCTVAAFGTFYDFVLVLSMIFNSFFTGFELLILEKEFLIDTTVTRCIRFAKKHEIWLVDDMTIQTFLKIG